MLSRHFYPLDGVRASCRYSLIRRHHPQAAFWAMELIDSMMTLELLEDICYAYLTSVGVANWSILGQILALLADEEIDTDLVLDLVHAICNVKEKDISILALVNDGLTEKQPDTVIPSSLVGWETETEHVQCCVRALQQGKYLLAWCLLRNSWSSDAWTILERFVADDPKRACVLKALKEEPYMEKFLWLSRAAAVLFVSRADEWKEIHWTAPSDVQKKMDEWSALEGRRARREMAIKAEAIHIGTERSILSNKETTLTDIRYPFEKMAGSPFWDSAAEEMGGWEKILRNSNVKEAFYRLYFPDDIPDEWSLKDQEKGHGIGLCMPGADEAVRAEKASRNLFSNCLSFGLQRNLVSGCRDFDALYAQVKGVDGWNLKPMKKKIVPIVASV